MSARLEWLTASYTHVGIVSPGDEAPDGQHAERDVWHTLILGHGDSGGVAIQGTLLDIEGMLNRAHAELGAALYDVVAARMGADVA